LLQLPEVKFGCPITLDGASETTQGKVPAQLVNGVANSNRR
jgi:hypothetical protein